ncbi:murein L,D-transpeptidase catalytic domain family protein [Marivirga salinae]|uniref:Murein L,D-transpeptidase catalytic domain family protein n=1 Tax=Marivirga salinarum TaxID=3059078 RepID=A0AA51NCM9_9BACT|nr:murein L,D-transpeptidase catalytic domain family protein [Marivirga sp. BDSF4-3]WMN11126.1 murein L,D-transpeptidase catalytic domain family protein [Marivirga sp. BDSF4-3]
MNKEALQTSKTMKFYAFGLIILLMTLGSLFKTKATNTEETLESFLNESYAKMKLSGLSRPPFDLYERGMIGYMNLLASGKRIDNQKITLIDFRISSKEKRLWIIDVEKNELLYYRLVAHGKNTGEDYAKAFSNIKNSNQSSLGFYLTGENYIGKHGFSLRLDGMESGFNDLARERAIVMHSAKYVDKDFAKYNGRLGRSFGCPAIALPQHREIIQGLANRSVLFIYYPKPKYEEGTQLNNKEKAEIYFQERYLAKK